MAQRSISVPHTALGGAVAKEVLPTRQYLIFDLANQRVVFAQPIAVVFVAEKTIKRLPGGMAGERFFVQRALSVSVLAH